MGKGIVHQFDFFWFHIDLTRREDRQHNSLRAVVLDDVMAESRIIEVLTFSSTSELFSERIRTGLVLVLLLISKYRLYFS